MIKSALVQRIAACHPHLYQRDVEHIVNAIFDEITAALKRGDRVELRGFGTFATKHRPSRVGRNPRTGLDVPVDAKRLPSFRPGKVMRERINRDDSVTDVNMQSDESLEQSGYETGADTTEAAEKPVSFANDRK